MKLAHKEYMLMIADNAMILGQRLGEWCGHGPILEQDIALTNIALDLIGEARNYYQYLASLEGSNEDDYPMLRDVREFKNILLVEQPNNHWGTTIMRQLMFDCYHTVLLKDLMNSQDKQVAAIAHKSSKEADYHLSFSSEWVIKLGDGTEKSHQIMQDSLNELIIYFDEPFIPEQFEIESSNDGFGHDNNKIKQSAFTTFTSIIDKATLDIPKNHFQRKGGKLGNHSEHLGYILAEMQYLAKSYPGAKW